jgi:formylglycine-generating enzyme required for sulfatase activity
LLNMAGNVREWCADYYASYRGGVVAGPARRVVRGGGFRSARDDCRGDVRDAAPPDVALPDLGLRIVLQLGLPPAS